MKLELSELQLSVIASMIDYHCTNNLNRDGVSQEFLMEKDFLYSNGLDLILFAQGTAILSEERTPSSDRDSPDEIEVSLSVHISEIKIMSVNDEYELTSSEIKFITNSIK